MTSLLSKLSPVPAFPSYTGPYQVGTTDLEIATSSLPQTVEKPPTAPSTIAFRLYYPCEKPSAPSKPVRWISRPQHEQLSSVWRFIGLGPSLSSWLTYALPHLSHVSLPAHRDAPVATSPNESTSTRWPVLIFSHGLGGSRNAYSYLCGCLAAHGIIVVAPDHRDGSQPISFVRGTQENESEKVHYRTMNHQPSEATYRGRDEQLQIRIWEISSLLEALHMVNTGTEKLRDLHDSSEGATGVISQLKDKLNLKPGQVTFSGHSFGATTTLQLLKSVYYRRTKNIMSSLFTPAPSSSDSAVSQQITPETPTILLDPWGLPINNPAQSALKAQPLPAYHSTTTSPPILTIMSQAFHDWRGNREQILEAVSPPSTYADKTYKPLVFYPSQSAHLSQSDFGLLFPRLTKYLAKAGEPKHLIMLNVRAVVELLRRRGLPVEHVEVEDAAVTEDDWVDVGGEQRGDSAILRTDGAVKGWNHVPPSSTTRAEQSKAHQAQENREAAIDAEEAGNMGNAEAFVVHGRKRSEPEDAHREGQVDSGTEEDMEGVINSGRA